MDKIIILILTEILTLAIITLAEFFSLLGTIFIVINRILYKKKVN